MTDVRAFYEDKDHVVWIGTSTGMYKADLNGAISPEHYLDEQVRCIFRDEQGNFWVGTFGGGLFLYSPAFETIKRFYEIGRAHV